MEEKELTPEQIKSIRQQHIEYWEDMIPYLEKKLAYERLITEADELIMRRLFAATKIANMQPPEEKTEPGKPMRALKKDE
jgi:hypothetical protein